MARAISVPAAHVHLFRAKVGIPELVEVPAARFLMVDGHGDPNTSSAFAQTVQTLYSGAYAVKFALKKAGGPDERVAPLEGLWWGGEAVDFAASSKDEWDWTMMIRIPTRPPTSWSPARWQALPPRSLTLLSTGSGSSCSLRVSSRRSCT